MSMRRNITPLFNNQRGTSLFVMFGIITVLFIFGVSLVYMTSQQVSYIKKLEARLNARYLAESVVERAEQLIHREFQRELVYHSLSASGEDIFEVNNKLLDLIDIRRIENLAKTHSLKPDELVKGGEASVIVEVMDVKPTDFYTYIDYQEKIPENLKVFQKPRNAQNLMDLEPLGGFKARVKFTGCGKFDITVHCTEEVRTLSVTDITPPAPDHTLFIHGEKKETLKSGEFQLSNLTLPPVIMKLLHQLSQQTSEVLGFEIGEDLGKKTDLIEKLNEDFNNHFRTLSLKMRIKSIQELSNYVADDNISETVDNIILSLSPRNWGRVRTNGRLEAYMPFFAADDVINYLAEKGSWRELPEIGYLFHDNRLHDPYMSVYTHYEGLIYKRYRKIYPSQFGIIEPEEVPPEQYTINTRLEYPRRKKDAYNIKGLNRIKENGLSVASAIFERPLKISGTKDVPIDLEGIWWFRSGVELGGYYTGRGLIISEQAITVTSDLLKLNERDSLAIVSLFNEVSLTKSDLTMQSAVYAHQGLRSRGCESVKIFGNLAVETLNREKMPERFFCRFDYHLKNHMVDNIFGHFSHDYTYYRRLDGRLNVEILSKVSSLVSL